MTTPHRSGRMMAMTVATRHIRIPHVLLALPAWGWSFFCFGSLAAASGGRLDVTLVVGGMLALPVALLPALGLRRGQALRLTALLLLSELCLAFAWLHLEAQWLLVESRRERKAVYIQRAWPFANSAVAYSPERGVWWDD